MTAFYVVAAYMVALALLLVFTWAANDNGGMS